jgi:integrase
LRATSDPRVEQICLPVEAEKFCRLQLPLCAVVSAAQINGVYRAAPLRHLLHRGQPGNQWTDSGLVFTTELGGPVDPRNLLRVIEAAADTVGVEGVGVHTLRHSAAVGWLEAGVHIKAVADLLGHSSVAITGDVYGHTSDDTARSAIDGLAGRLGL